VDKFIAFSGREADPISLAYQRTLTYQHRKRIFKVSSPTNREGAIWKSYEASGDRRHFEVPCPFCGTFQRLVFTQVKWPKLDIPDKVRLADEIQVNKLAWYECSKCKARIEDSRKPAMLLKGLWVSEGQSVTLEGKLIGERPRSKRVGFHISCLYSPWPSFADAVAEFIRCEHDPAKTMNFRNSWLAEPFELQVAKTAPSFIREKSFNAPPPGIVPAWARALVASADTQGTTARDGWFPYVVRAWGYEFRSQLIEHGIANSFEELRQRCLNKVFPLENGQNLVQNAQNASVSGGAGATGGQIGPNGIAPQVLFIDSGGPRWSEVYQFAQSDRLRIRPTKGSSTTLATLLGKSHQKNHDIVLFNIDTEKAKDLLYRLIHDPDLGKWAVNSGIDEDYISQMASEHKVLERKTGKELWVKVTSGSANHMWDTEVLQCAAAFDLGAGNPEPRPIQVANDPKPEKQKFDWVHSRPPIRPRPR
jgi:phage terminase large subunit GpA-like protein